MGRFSLSLCLILAVLSRARGDEILQGDLGAHDPSTIIACKEKFWVFSTGRGCHSKYSTDLVKWHDGPRVFDPLPAWVSSASPENNGDVWAPDVAYLGGQYRLYYSVSAWGSKLSAIALATNPTLDPEDPSFLWTDRGIVIQSTESSDFNAIDPAIFPDAGRLWLSFGSYVSGIKLIELSPATGKRISPSSPIHSLADHSSIEASYLHKRGTYYYLFVNWGSCCSGVDSSYNIRVGRSRAVTGPYLDRAGVSLLDGGGTLFLETSGKFIGPGHMGIFAAGGAQKFGCHYYDGTQDGAPKVDIEPLSWDASGWPLFRRDWMATYSFQEGALDEMGEFDGSLEGGAAIVEDPVRGKVLDLPGGGEHASLLAAVANARTFSAWIKWSGGEAWQRVFDFGADTSRYLCLTPRASSGRMRFAITESGPGGEGILESPSPLPVGVWTHVGVTLDGTRGTLYANGKPLATKTDMPVEPWMLFATSAWLGKSQFPADPPFQGQIDSVRIFARALSASEMAALAGAGDDELLCWYRLDEDVDVGGSATARDSSANLVHATVRGDPSWDSDALWLDGEDDYLQTPVANGSERTLAAWIHPLSSADVTYIGSVFDTDVPGQYGSGWGLDRGRLKVILDNQFWEPGATVALGRWTNVALVFGKASARLYRDGSLVASLSYSQGDVSRAWYRIGRSNANELYFHGGIRDARIYSRALTAEEVREIFDAGDRRGLFVRGDPNGDGALDLSDAVLILRGLFLGTGDPPCKGAADLNADLTIDMSDAIYELSFLFTGGPPPEPPYPDCGREGTGTGLGCVSYPPCE